MLTCPMCGSLVERFKSGSHIMPRGILKRTKTGGRNVKIDLEDKTVAINQADERSEFWCEGCERQSAMDDAYGIEVLIHRTQGTLSTMQFRSGRRFKVFEALDYTRFKKFVVSIVIREQLYRTNADRELLMTGAQLQKLVDAYYGRNDDVGITGSFLVDEDPASGLVTPPVPSRARDGSSFQIFNYMFLLYFERTRREVQFLSMTPYGRLFMIETTRDQTGSLQNLDEHYRALMKDPKNQSTADKIMSKYSDNS